jgi:hypothetical protein
LFALPFSSVLAMKAVRVSAILVKFGLPVWHQVPKDIIPHNHRTVNLKTKNSFSSDMKHGVRDRHDLIIMRSFYTLCA